MLASTDAFRAWWIGVTLVALTVWLPFFIPFGIGFYLVPLGVATLALYTLTVRPRAFAASGVLLGIAPFFAWGVIDGLQKCAKFNRGGPSGGCEADPTAQVALTALVYGGALLLTGLAVWSARRADS